MVRRAVDLDVVIRRVLGAVGQLLRDQAEELVLDLVRARVADKREVRLKIVKRPSSLSVKVEADDLAATPGRLARDALRRKAERDKED